MQLTILIVRAKADCFRKGLDNLDTATEQLIRKTLRVLSSPYSYGYSDIQCVSTLKNRLSKLLDNASELRTLNAVSQYVADLDDSEQVVLLDFERFTNFDIFVWQRALIAHKEGRNIVEEHHYWKYEFKNQYFPRHTLYFFADFGYEQYYGEWDKSKRQCRFCKQRGEKIFGDKKSAHALSYFLGNKSLYCLEECKECNNQFGKGIEAALRSYYQYYFAADNRKSRKGKQLTAQGFNYEQDGEGLHYYSQGQAENTPRVGESIPPEGIQLHLDNLEPVILHDVYRVLVKYVLACLPNTLLPAFSKTADWVLGKKHPPKGVLPPVYRIETLPIVRKPSLCVYVRNDNKKDLPYCVGEIRFMENLYLFAVPYCRNHDAPNASLAKPLAEFVARRYPDRIFTIQNFCDDEEKMITNHINIEGGGTEVLQPLTPEERIFDQQWLRARDKKLDNLAKKHLDRFDY